MTALRRVVALSCVAIAGAGLGACSLFRAPPPESLPTPLQPVEALVKLHELWRDDVGAADKRLLTPAVVGDSVFSAAAAGHVSRHDDGREVWRIDIGAPISGGVGANNDLVAAATPKGDVLALNAADGALLWRARVSSEVLAPPVVAGDLVLVRSADAQVFAFAAADGERRWVYQRDTPTLSLRAAAGLAANDDAVFVGYPGGKLAALSRGSGSTLWLATLVTPRGVTEIERIVDIVGEPLLYAGSVCAIAYQGRLACFDITSGRQLWSIAMSSINGVAGDERALYVSDDEGRVLAFDRNNGEQLWLQEMLLRRRPTLPLALGRHLVVADYEGVVHVLSAFDGAIVGRSDGSGDAVAAPLRRLPGEGAFVLQTQQGALRALQIR